MPPVKSKPKGKKPNTNDVTVAGQNPTKATEIRPVKYPDLAVQWCIGDDALTVEQAMSLLGWTTEQDEVKDNQGRVIQEAVRFDESLPPGLVDMYGRKVRCLNNVGNRPFYLDTAESYCQSILNREWADSHNGGKVTLPVLLRTPEGDFDPEGKTELRELDELTVNGETIIIDRYGDVDSGQHRLIALVWAGERWDGAKVRGSGDQSLHWKAVWPEKPRMECPIFFGVSADPKVKRSLDNGRTRTLADVAHTEGFFAGRTYSERLTLNKVLDRTVSILWSRTGMKKDAYRRYRTNTEAIEFVRRHPHIEAAVLHVWQEGKTPKKPEGWKPGQAVPRGAYQKLGLNSRADCAALMYLMGVSASNPDDYYHDRRQEMKSSGEGVLDLSLWDKAARFWTDLAKGTRGPLKRVVGAIDDLKSYLNPESGEEVNLSMRLAVICRAWVAYAADKPMTDKNLSIEDYMSEKVMTKDQNGKEVPESRDLVKDPSVGGIDLPEVGAPSEPEEDDGTEGSNDTDGNNESEVRPGPKDPPRILTLEEELRAKMAEYPGKVLIFRGESVANVWGGHAVTVARALGLKTEPPRPDGIARLKFPSSDLNRYVSVLLKANHPVHVIEMNGANQSTSVDKLDDEASIESLPDPEGRSLAEDHGATSEQPTTGKKLGRGKGNKKPVTKKATTSRGNR